MMRGILIPVCSRRRADPTGIEHCRVTPHFQKGVCHFILDNGGAPNDCTSCRVVVYGDGQDLRGFRLEAAAGSASARQAWQIA